MKISKKKIIQIEETLKDFKALIPRFKEIKDKPILLKMLILVEHFHNLKIV